MTVTWQDLTGPVAAVVLLVIGMWATYKGWVYPKPIHDEILKRQGELFSTTAAQIGKSLGQTINKDRDKAIEGAVRKGIARGLPQAISTMQAMGAIPPATPSKKKAKRTAKRR